MPFAEEIKKLEDATRSMEELKVKGLLPAEQADASISALKHQLTTHSSRTRWQFRYCPGT